MKGEFPATIQALFPIWLFSLLLGACDFERTIEVKLPPHDKQLVAECYLERDQPFRIALTETNSYFDSLRLPFVNEATVVLKSSEGWIDTLRFFPYLDFFNRKFYNFETLRDQFDTTAAYTLEISDPKGRKLTGQTRFLPLPSIDTAYVTYNDDSVARFQLFINDFPGVSNFYRLVFNEDSLTGAPTLDFEFTDQNLDGRRIPVGTTYRFQKGKNMFIRLYHMEPQYYRYLESTEDAERANGNPFAQPATVFSAMQGGGFGIFTTLNYRQFSIRY